MITEAHITVIVHLDHKEIPVCMLYIWEFSENDSATITGIKVSEVKKIREALRCKFGGRNGQGTRAHALQRGFNVDGTLNEEDIFTDKQKRLISEIDPTIEFRFPVKVLEHAPL